MYQNIYQDNDDKLPVEQTNCDFKKVHIHSQFALVSLWIGRGRIMTFWDEIFEIMFVATVAKIFDYRIVDSFAIKYIPTSPHPQQNCCLRF